MGISITAIILIAFALIRWYIKPKLDKPFTGSPNNDNYTDNVNSKNIEKIVAMDFMENSNKVVLAKVDLDYKLFIEIVDIKNDFKEIIYLDEDFFLDYKSLYYYHEDKLALSMIFNSGSNTRKLSYVNKFKCLSYNNFYLNISSSVEEKWADWHLKINFSGNVIEKIIGELDERSRDSRDINLVFFDTKEFRQINLTEFFDVFFEEDSFSYNRVMGDSIEAFFSSDNKNLGICYFFKDEEIPRGRFSVFNIQNFENPELIFSFKIDDYGNDIKFTNDNSKISYWRWEKDENDENLIQYVIREVNEFSFEKEKRFNVKFNDVVARNYYFINNTILEEYYDKFQIHNTDTKENMTVLRNNYSPYCINENTLVYLNNYKLEKLIIH